MNPYRRAWGELRRPLRRAIEESPSTTLILHMPKTGGSTLSYSVTRAASNRSSSSIPPSLRFLELPSSLVDPHACECGTTLTCDDHLRRSKFGPKGSDQLPDLPLVVIIGHESYRAVNWVRKAAGRNSAPCPVVLAVRPRRDRLRSMFRDYWTQVAIASGNHPDDMPPSLHRKRLLARYPDDAAHYCSADGSINGVAWFQSFSRYGPGVVFYLDEVFGGDTTRMQHELTTGALRLVPTKDLSGFIEEFTQRPVPSQKRTAVKGDPAVEAALDDASDLVEDLARRDAPFDRIIADHLGDPGFFVE